MTRSTTKRAVGGLGGLFGHWAGCFIIQVPKLLEIASYAATVSLAMSVVAGALTVAIALVLQ